MSGLGDSVLLNEVTYRALAGLFAGGGAICNLVNVPIGKVGIVANVRLSAGSTNVAHLSIAVTGSGDCSVSAVVASGTFIVSVVTVSVTLGCISLVMLKVVAESLDGTSLGVCAIFSDTRSGRRSCGCTGCLGNGGPLAHGMNVVIVIVAVVILIVVSVSIISAAEYSAG